MLIDLKLRIGQRRPGGPAVHGVVLSGGLGHLDLSGDGGVLPLHGGCLASGDVDRLHLGVHQIALVLQLLKVVPPGGSQVLDVDVTGIIRGVLPDGLVAAVVEQEGHAVYPLAGGAVGLMQQDTGEGFVGDGDHSGFSVLHCKVVGRIVELVPIRRLGFHRIVITGVQIQQDMSVLAGGDGIHETIVHAADLKGDVRQPLGAVGFIYFDDLHAAHRRVVKLESLSVSHLDLDGLGGGVQEVAVQGTDLLGDDGLTGFQTLDHDAAIFIGHILAVGAAKHLSVGPGDQEGHALQGRGGAGDVLFDDQPGLGVILEGEIVAAVGTAAHVSRAAGGDVGGPAHGPAAHRIGAIFHDDGLGRGIEDIAAGNFRLDHDHGAAGNEARDRHSPVLAGGVAAQHSAIAVLDGELGARDRLPGDGVQFGQRQAAQGFVQERQSLRIQRVDCDSLDLGGLVDDIAGGGLGLLDHHSANDTVDADLALVIAIGNPPLLLSS